MGSREGRARPRLPRNQTSSPCFINIFSRAARSPIAAAVWRGAAGRGPLLRCARGPKRKPIKVRFMFIKCLSKLKNFLINSNLAGAPALAGGAAPAGRLVACDGSGRGLR